MVLCATSVSYAQADGIVALQSSDVEMAWNGAVKEKNVIKSGSCGANVKYELYDDYTLRIYGNGEMDSFDYWGDGVLHDTSVPWIYEVKKIKTVVVIPSINVLHLQKYQYQTVLKALDIQHSESVTHLLR